MDPCTRNKEKCNLPPQELAALKEIIILQKERKIVIKVAEKGANPYTKLENLAWSQTVFLQFTFCRTRRFMKPLLLSSVAIFIHNTGCLFLTDMIQ